MYVNKTPPQSGSHSRIPPGKRESRSPPRPPPARIPGRGRGQDLRYVPPAGRGVCGGSHLILQHSPRGSRQRDRRRILVTNGGALMTVWRRQGRRQDTRRVAARPAQSRDIARRPPALSRHAAVPTRADGMGAVPTPANGCGGATAPCPPPAAGGGRRFSDGALRPPAG